MYSLIKTFFFVFGNLPYWLLYSISYLLHLLMFYVIKYRKEVVLDNISKSFPDKTTTEHKQIAKGFYLHLTDLMVETIKLGFTSEKTIMKRYQVVNPEMYSDSKFQGISLVYMAHYGNFEYSCTIPKWVKNKHIAAVYQQQKNKSFDRYFLWSRSRFGAEPILNKKIFEYVSHHLNTPSFIGLLSDLTPHFGRIEHHTTFLGRKTPVHIGVETIATRHNLPTYYMRIKKIKRGFYTSELIPIEPKKTNSKYPLTDRYFELVEEDIQANPSYWLWSHRRWKYASEE